MNTDKYALVTGASKGIGKELSVLLARRGYNLLLVARSQSDLQMIAESIEQDHKVKVLFMPCDLSEKEAAKKVADWCNANTSNLSVLINNAGYGLFGKVEDLELQDQLNMLQLNINAVVELTYHLLPALKNQKQSYILNLSSTAAYQPVPNLAIYAASKSFILSYSRALRYELKDTSVVVSCLCPGPTDTGFASRAGLDVLAELAEKFNMSPTFVAETGLNGMFKKKAEIIPGFLNKISSFGANHLPKSLIERITASLYKD